MRCPFCGNEDTQVKDSRPTEDNSAIRRRRQCPNCGARFTTFERVQLRELTVLKSNDKRETFDRDKLLRSMTIALRKRPVDPDRVERVVNGIVRRLESSGESEIPTKLIGELIMDALASLDSVAYVRFASVYRDFREAQDFEKFIEKLGTLADKSTRVSKLAEIALEMSGADGVDKQQVDRASHIAKADLASEMIKDGKEFTLLQGLIGSCYASESGEDPEIITAILEQYMPRSPGDGLPTTELGTALSIADRIDTITGCFLAALVPTGSQDPYALRRQANGLLRLLEARPGVSIRRLLEVALDGYIDGGFADADNRSDAFDRLIGFFQSRMALYLKDRGIDYDIVSAVTAVAWENPGVAWERARVIQSLRGDIAFELLVTGAKRVSNILDDSMKRFGLEWPELEAAFQGSGELAPGVRIDPDGFEEASGKALYQEVRSAVPTLRERDSARDEKAILSALSGLGPAIDRFFDDVLVNSPDADVRLRRHHFLAGVFAIFAKYADLSHIVESGSQPPE
ncbi:MAG: transcriptional repressor NrdR [Proteobacteria bacterium]|nr:transcriptional repressor NrdR [Pseudomonadota bacterium]